MVDIALQTLPPRKLPGWVGAPARVPDPGFGPAGHMRSPEQMPVLFETFKWPHGVPAGVSKFRVIVTVLKSALSSYLSTCWPEAPRGLFALRPGAPGTRGPRADFGGDQNLPETDRGNPLAPDPERETKN